MRYWKWMLGLGVLAVAIGASFIPKKIPVDVSRIERGNLEVVVEEDGRTRVRDRYTVFAPLNGMLRRPSLRVGDPVIAGETVLGIIDPGLPAFLDARTREETQARIEAAVASKERAAQQLEGAKTSLAFAKKELNRLKSLGNIVSSESLDNAAYTLDLRESEAVAARKALRIAQFELETQRAALNAFPQSKSGTSDPLVLKAPVDGFVFRVFEESAGPVSLKTPIMEIADPNHLEVVVDLLSKDAVKVTAGQRVYLKHWGGEEALRGRVRLVEPSGFTKVSALGVEEQRVNVVVDIVDEPKLWQSLGDGFRVEAAIVIWAGEDLLRVSSSALFWSQDQWMVFVLTEGKAVLNPIEIGKRNSWWTEVKAGLDEGQTVILHPGDQVANGIRVKPRS